MLIDRVFEHHAVSLAIGFVKRVQLGANVAQVGDARRFGNVIEPCVIAYFGQVGYDARGVLLDNAQSLDLLAVLFPVDKRAYQRDGIGQRLFHIVRHKAQKVVAFGNHCFNVFGLPLDFQMQVFR